MSFIINPYTFVAPFTGILDTYTGAAYGYSFRRLSSTYTGNCIQVRRSSDNTTQDIGFVNNYIDTSSLLSFVGAGNGFVTIWYDQSGNSRNATQSTLAWQPQVVSSGSLILNSSGKITFNCNSSQLTNTLVMNSGTSQSTFTAWQCETTGQPSGGFLLPFGTFQSVFAINYFGGMASGGSGSPDLNVGTPSYYKNGSSSALTRTSGSLYTAFVTGINTLNSVIGGSMVNTSNGRLLQYTNPGGGIVGNYKISEQICWLSNQSSNKSGIETNINNYWTIY